MGMYLKENARNVFDMECWECIWAIMMGVYLDDTAGGYLDFER